MNWNGKSNMYSKSHCVHLFKTISIIGKKRLNYRPSDVLSWLFKDFIYVHIIYKSQLRRKCFSSSMSGLWSACSPVYRPVSIERSHPLKSSNKYGFKSTICSQLRDAHYVRFPNATVVFTDECLCRAHVNSSSISFFVFFC